MATLREHIERIVTYTLYQNDLNQSKSAKELGISRGTLRKYMKETTPANRGRPKTPDKLLPESKL